ncbi:hypothetical protein ACQEU5_24980 [Marinactinospora thermotolerans]|uniref:hypothetical protein n=1 Tax=Marinactinospora thermotolerans TaxID=531310 RepID=UPI003D8FB4BF
MQGAPQLPILTVSPQVVVPGGMLGTTASTPEETILEVVFYYALYGALDFYWHRYGKEMDRCDIPPALVYALGERAQQNASILITDLDAAFEMLEKSGVPKRHALACLRYNLTQPGFPEAVLPHVRGLLASLELHGTAAGR